MYLFNPVPLTRTVTGNTAAARQIHTMPGATLKITEQ
jgi:hypothetical protein